MRLVIFDDELLFSEALSALLALRGHLPACATTTDDLLELIDASKDDACLANVRPPTGRAADVIQRVKQSAPEVPVVALSDDSEAGILWEALEAGADGVCLKVDGIDEIESVLMQVTTARTAPARGPAIWSRAATTLARQNTSRPRGTTLTAKERAVLELLTEGLSTATIATQLNIGEATARTHIQHLFNKFGVHSRLALVASAVRSDTVRIGDQNPDGATS